MNTRINYCHREDDDVFYAEEVIIGTFTDEQEQVLFEDYNVEEFYPDNIGFQKPSFDDYESEESVCELLSIEDTFEEATVDMNVKEFLAFFEDGTATTYYS